MDYSAWGGPTYSIYPDPTNGYAAVGGNANGRPPQGVMLQTLSSLCVGATYQVTANYAPALLPENGASSVFAIVVDGVTISSVILEKSSESSTYSPLPSPVTFVATKDSETIQFQYGPVSYAGISGQYHIDLAHISIAALNIECPSTTPTPCSLPFFASTDCGTTEAASGSTGQNFAIECGQTYDTSFAATTVTAISSSEL